MFSNKYILKNRPGIKFLDRVGPYLVITNKLLFEIGESRRYALVNETERVIDSIYSSQNAAVVFAHKQNQ
jgi:hypothetical protein